MSANPDSHFILHLIPFLFPFPVPVVVVAMFAAARSLRTAASRSGSYAALPRSMIARNMNSKVNGELCAGMRGNLLEEVLTCLLRPGRRH